MRWGKPRYKDWKTGYCRLAGAMIESGASDITDLQKDLKKEGTFWQQRISFTPLPSLSIQNASFWVQLFAGKQENVPLCLPTITSFAFPGTLAEWKLLRKSQQESSFSSSHVRKTHLSKWDLNVSTQVLCQARVLPQLHTRCWHHRCH